MQHITKHHAFMCISHPRPLTIKQAIGSSLIMDGICIREQEEPARYIAVQGMQDLIYGSSKSQLLESAWNCGQSLKVTNIKHD